MFGFLRITKRLSKSAKLATHIISIGWWTIFLASPLQSAEAPPATDYQVVELKAYNNINSVLPPLIPWKGNSERLIHDQSDPWQTPAEASNLTDTPSYQETFKYFDRLVASDKRLTTLSIGTSPQGRDIWMIVASSNGAKSAKELSKNKKPTLLVQAGIHSGEIDGKDAGLMLLRDIVQGDKGHLIDNVNWLFVPILSVDAHERRSPHNRVNQRGPHSMGWRTNATNLNLNRDYAKLQTPELRQMIEMINTWQPDLYYDVHVTDGEDYQYDITYGFNVPYGPSPNISKWFSSRLSPRIDRDMKINGHLPGPLTFGVDPMNFSKGIVGWTASPRFSNGYGDYRHLPTMLVENHSLKPYKQRVLGTYILIESTLKLLAETGNSLREAIMRDQSQKLAHLTVAWETDQSSPTSMDFEGIAFENKTDTLTGLNYVQWTGKPKTYTNLPVYWMNKAKSTVKIPKAYWIPPQYQTVINILKSHGIEMTEHAKTKQISGNQLEVTSYEFAKAPFEGRQMPTASFKTLPVKSTMPAGAIKVKTDQPLGHLAVALLDPRATDSLFSWGFFNTIFQRTEYIESYILVPLARQLFRAQPDARKQFESLKATDESFAKDPKKQLQWIYERTRFYDGRFLKYPVIFGGY